MSEHETRLLGQLSAQLNNSRIFSLYIPFQPLAARENLFLRPERPGMEFHGLADVRQEICQAVITGIKLILVSNALGLELLVQGLSALFKAVVILLAAVEVDG